MAHAPPALPGHSVSESPLDRALAMQLAGEHDAALRWSAAVIKHDPSVASALILTARLLAEAGRQEAAVEAFSLGVKRAIDAGNLPLAVAAAQDLIGLQQEAGAQLDEIAGAFCAGSPRLADGTSADPPPLKPADELEPLSSFLTGPALLSKVSEIVKDAQKQYDAAAESVPLIAPLPLFSSLDRASLRALIGAFEMITVAADQVVVEEGENGAEAYIVARGELEVRKSTGNDEPPLTLARLTGGALFGEMALLARAPRAASVVACRPSILLIARKDELEKVAREKPEVGLELAAHCRRRMVANLVRTSPVLLAVPADERPALVERFETRVYEEGERLITQGNDAAGIHLIASGEVTVVRREGDEPFVISTLGPGQVVGEVALVLRRKSNADVVAVHPSITLHLAREEFISMVREHPTILHGLYLLAVERDEETSQAIENSTTSVADEYIIV